MDPNKIGIGHSIVKPPLAAPSVHRGVNSGSTLTKYTFTDCMTSIDPEIKFQYLWC